MHFTGIHTDFLGAKEGACITSAYGKSDSKWPLKSVCLYDLEHLRFFQSKIPPFQRKAPTTYSLCTHLRFSRNKIPTFQRKVPTMGLNIWYASIESLTID